MTRKRQRASRQARGYDAAWYKLQESHLAANPTCPCGQPATQADHVIPFNAADPLNDPLRLDASNLQSLCIVCHAKKTAEDQAAKSRPGPKRVYMDDERADRERERSRKNRAETTRAGQEINAIPEVKDWARREACLHDAEKFLREYWGVWPYFYKPFCKDHLRIIAKGEDAMRSGGNFAVANDNGDFPDGHTAYGLRHFIFLIGAASGLAKRSLSSIKKMIVDSPEFAADFPEIAFPVLALGSSINRQKGQVCLGIPTRINWSGEYIRTATLPEQPSMRADQHENGGSIVFASGLTGSSITGMNIDGVRPDFVLLDDPQTRESAMKDASVQKREEIIDATVAGLAAPGTRLACLMPCTVIRENDLADHYLNHALHPEWAIERAALLPSFPANMEIWEQNAEIRRNFNPHAGPEDKQRAAAEGTAHYVANRVAMDLGAVASWDERFNDDEVSAIQNAMNMYADNRRAFFAEMQNKPLPPDLGDIKPLTSDEICNKLNRVPRGVVPVPGGVSAGR